MAVAKDLEKRKLLALVATQGNNASDVLAAGYSASAVLAAGYSASTLRAAGYSASTLRAAGCSASSLLAAGYSASDVRAAGYSASTLRAAGCSASSLLAAGYSASDVLAAGYSASTLRAAGCSASTLRAAGYSASAVLAAGYSASALRDWDEIPVIEKPYTKMLADIKAGRRKHNQADFGPDCDPKTNLCKTPMCTAGHLVNMAGEVGYKLLKKYGSFPNVAAWIHAKARPDVPPQKFGSIPQEWAMAYIEERAAEEAQMEKKKAKSGKAKR